MGAPEIQTFLVYLATEGNVSTQNQALSAILFLYREVLHQEIEPVLLPSAKRPQRLPTVLTRDEALRLLNQMDGVRKRMAQLLYSSGLRLWVQDIDFEYRTITVRDGKGEKDRIVPLPETVIPERRRQIERVRLLHQEDLAAGRGEVYLPDALERKYPNAVREFIWQCLFPAPRRSVDPRSGKERRHHTDPSSLQRAVKQAAQKAGIQKRMPPHTAALLCHPKMVMISVPSRNCWDTKMSGQR